MQIKQRIFKFYGISAFSLQHSETYDISHAFLPLAVAKLSMLKRVHFLVHHVNPSIGALGCQIFLKSCYPMMAKSSPVVLKIFFIIFQ